MKQVDQLSKTIMLKRSRKSMGPSQHQPNWEKIDKGRSG